jgi:hypothetical protein
LNSIVSAAASSREVSLAGFGKFKVKASPEREGGNPANGEKIKIVALKKRSFSPTKAAIYSCFWSRPSSAAGFVKVHQFCLPALQQRGGPRLSSSPGDADVDGPA